MARATRHEVIEIGAGFAAASVARRRGRPRPSVSRIPWRAGPDAVGVVVDEEMSCFDTGDEREASNACARADGPGRTQQRAAVLQARGRGEHGLDALADDQRAPAGHSLIARAAGQRPSIRRSTLPPARTSGVRAMR